MSIELLHLRKGCDHGLTLLDALAIVLHKARSSQKIGDAHAAEESASATCRQHVTWSGCKVTECRWRVVASHDRSSRGDVLRERLRRTVGDHQLEMLRRHVVRHLCRLSQVCDFESE